MSSADSLTELPDLRGLAIGCGASGIVLLTIVLVNFAYLAWNPTSRPYLNRVSFRLLVYGLVSNLVWLACSLPILNLTGPGAACTFVAFGSNTALMATACFFFSISLNLVLVLVYGFDGCAMEKYYLIATFITCAVCNITPLAAGEYGFWARGQTCWFNEQDPAAHLRWLIGARAFPLLLMAIADVVLFGILLSFMLGPRMNTNRVISDPSTSSPLTAPPPPIVRYRGRILRIGLYPLCSFVLNFTGCILDLYGSNYIATVQAITPVLVKIAYSNAVLFSLRGIFYALLAVTDPSFIRAFQALHAAPTSDWSVPFPSTSTSLKGPLGLRSQLAPVGRNKRFSFGGQAMVRVELERFEDRTSTDTHSVAGAQEKPQEQASPRQEAEVELGPSLDEPPVRPHSGIRWKGTGARRPSKSVSDEIECQI